MVRIFAFFWLLVACLAGNLASAQINAPARPVGNYKNSVSAGLSYGVQNDRDADFWGWSVDYGRRLTDRWIGSAALTWDRETERFNDGRTTDTSTFTLVGTVSYALSERFSLTTGLGKGIANTSNPSRTMKFASGDWGTGIALGLSTDGLPHFTRDSISFSVSYEYNLTERETSLSADVSFGWSF